MTVSTISSKVKVETAMKNSNGNVAKAVEKLIDSEMATYSLKYEDAKKKVSGMIKEAINEIKQGK